MQCNPSVTLDRLSHTTLADVTSVGPLVKVIPSRIDLNLHGMGTYEQDDGSFRPRRRRRSGDSLQRRFPALTQLNRGQPQILSTGQLITRLRRTVPAFRP